MNREVTLCDVARAYARAAKLIGTDHHAIAHAEYQRLAARFDLVCNAGWVIYPDGSYVGG